MVTLNHFGMDKFETVLKGEAAGHPFRGNQHTSSSGGGAGGGGSAPEGVTQEQHDGLTKAGFKHDGKGNEGVQYYSKDLDPAPDGTKVSAQIKIIPRGNVTKLIVKPETFSRKVTVEQAKQAIDSAKASGIKVTKVALENNTDGMFSLRTAKGKTADTLRSYASEIGASLSSNASYD